MKTPAEIEPESLAKQIKSAEAKLAKINAKIAALK
jgi:hypothetical protein